MSHFVSQVARRDGFSCKKTYSQLPIGPHPSHFPHTRSALPFSPRAGRNLCYLFLLGESHGTPFCRPIEVQTRKPTWTCGVVSTQPEKKKKNVRDEIFPVHEVLWDVLHRICQVESIVVAVHAFMSSLCKLNRVARVAKSKFLIAVRQLVQSFSVGMDCNQHCFKNFFLLKKTTCKSNSALGIVPIKIPPRRRYLDTFSIIILAFAAFSNA